VNDWFDAEQHVERAHELYEAGRWEEAESALRSALRLNPFHAEWHFNLGLTLDAAGRHAEALATFGEAFALKRDTPELDAQTALLAGTCALRLPDPARALDWFDKAAALHPRSAEIAAARIDALAQLGQHEPAEEAFYLAIEHDAAHAELYAAMAESLLARGQTDRAVWCLREAARLDPGLPRVQARLAAAYAAAGRLERARQLYLRELRNDPGDLDSLLDLGDLLTDMHRPAEAAEKYRRVLELEPDNTDAHFALGRLAADGLATPPPPPAPSARDEAIRQFDIVVRLDPDYPGARRALAAALLAHAPRDEHARADRDRARDLLVRDLAWLRKRDDAATRDAATTGVSDHPAPNPTSDLAQDLAEVGPLLLDAALADRAVWVFRRLVELRPGDHAAWHHLGVACFECGRHAEGMEHTHQALIFEPRYVPAMHNLAVAHLRRREWLRARYWVQRAWRTDPDDPAVRRLRVRLGFTLAFSAFAWFGNRAARAARCLWGATLGRPARA
jgi:tetratricopeptide (TPR) repeat protein